MKLGIYLIIAYLFGGIPFGLIVSKVFRGIDIRKLGSGNIGATNVLRNIGWKAGVLVLILDAAKGFFPVLLMISALPDNHLGAVLAAIAAMLGHTFSPFLRFTGGRGVATGLGVMLALSWQSALCCFALAILLMALFRYVSLGSIVGAASLPFFAYIYKAPDAYIIFTVLAAILVIVRHVPNIKRLLSGTESKLGQKSHPIAEGQEDEDKLMQETMVEDK